MTIAWPVVDVYLDTVSAPLTAADFSANVTNLLTQPNIGNLTPNGVVGFSTSVGRQNAQAYFDAGTLTIVFDNQNGQFDPTYASAIPNLRVGNHISVVGTPSGGSGIALFSGYISSFVPTYGIGSEQMTITAVDMFKYLNLLTWSPAAPVAAQTADARVRQILTDCGFSSSWVVVPSPAPTSICAAIPANPDTGLMDHVEPALGAMQAAVHDTEDGLLYVRPDGRLVVAGRYLRGGTLGAAFCTLGDLFSSTTEIPYEPDIQLPNDDTLLVNGYTVTDANGDVFTYSDPTSIGKYGPSFGSVTSLSATPNEGYDQAVYRVITNDAMGTRVDQVTVNPLSTSAPNDFVVLGSGADGWNFETDVVTVNRRPPSGNVVTQTCFVERVLQSFDGVTWSVQIGLSAAGQFAAATTWWVLGTGQLGVTSGANNTKVGR